LLLRASHLTGADDLAALAEAAGSELGAVRSVVYVIDYDQVLLVPLTSPPAVAGPESLPVGNCMAGRAFTDVEQQAGPGGEATLWTPILDGTDRVGVLQTTFTAEEELTSELRAACSDMAALLAELVVTRGAYGDAVERARRRADLTVPAELQWTLLPPLTFVTPAVSIAGILAPTREVAGDSFDYALNDGIAHLAILDAMGHGMQAALLSAVAVSVLRNARRAGAALTETVRLMDEAIRSSFGVGPFVTAIVGELDLATGWWRWITCGHLPALLVRDGRVVKVLDQVVAPPIGPGLLPDRIALGAERLQPGDRLVLYTDGVVEARASDGSFFGMDRLVEFVGRQAASRRPVAESLRRLNQAILDYQDGKLQDDATTVLVEWSPPDPHVEIPSPHSALD
jgi:serine phosphatase RsbU (regulator of sigma subunit)